MRKLLWCCSAAGVLAAGGLFATMYFACCCPDSTVGRFVYTAATVTYAIQPLRGLASMVESANHPATTAGSIEECVPPEPQPIEPEMAATIAGFDPKPAVRPEPEPAAIVIPEDEGMPRVDDGGVVPATIDIAGLQGQELPDSACPMVMPYCVDDDEPMPKRTMPYADAEKKQADGSEASEDGAFKEWMKLFDESSKQKKIPGAEELPLPREEPKSATKCEEDIHRHEHYPGCPPVTCPYSGKSYPDHASSPKSGKEEISEEPPRNKHLDKTKGTMQRRRGAQGVDTMEYRPSDGGLNEYGRGPL